MSDPTRSTGLVRTVEDVPRGKRREPTRGMGVGAQASRRYCSTCGAKKVKGECPRGHA